MLRWLVFSLLAISLTGADETWYQGCYERKAKNSSIKPAGVDFDNLVNCAKFCTENGYSFTGVQSGADIRCWCLDSPEVHLQNTPDNRCCTNSTLPEGFASDCWSVYKSSGPYLSQLSIEVDSRWIVINSPIHIEIVAELASPLNFSTELTHIGKQLKMNWYIAKAESQGSELLDFGDNVETFRSIRQIFTEIGHYRIDVNVSNGISNLSSGLDLEVIYPEPKDLQLGMLDDLDLPSCIPDEFNISHLLEAEESILAVFVNASVRLEASVAMGTNLTFNFLFEDTGKVKGQTCEDCTSIVQEHIFTEIGLYGVEVTVSNNYGNLSKTVTMVVIARVLKDLDLVLHPDSDPLTLLNDPVNFIVSMVTTSRTNIFLKLEYGDNVTNLVPIKDTNTSGLVLHGDGKEMEIIANYGEGCKLMVEFQYLYRKEGTFKPAITVIKNSSDIAVLDELENNKDLVIAGLYTELKDDIFVVKEITAARIESERVAKCYEDTEFILQFVPSFNLSVHWTIRALDDDGDHVIDELVLTSLEMMYRFTIAGAYTVSAEVSNSLSSAHVSINIVIQCPVKGLMVTCLEEYIPTAGELNCVAEVQSGTNAAFLWLLEGPIEAKHVFYENYTSVLRTKLSNAGEYYITVQVGNNISFGYLEVEPSVKVQDPIDHIVVYKVSKTLLGNSTDFIAVYHPTNSHVNYKCNFDFDFGEGRKNIPNTICRDRRCYVRTSYIFPVPGYHKVLVYGYNEVSEVRQEVEVWIIPGLDEITVEITGTPVVGQPVRFLLKEKGVTMATENVYFNWKFSEEERVHCTNSPLVEKVFTDTGDYLVVLNATNPVTSKVLEIPLTVREQHHVPLLLLHDLYVAPGDDLHFTLKGPLIGWSKLLVTYSDGSSQSFDGITYQWSHSFQELGTQHVNVTLLGAEETSIEVMTSYIMVQEPIRDLVLRGPQAVAFERNRTGTWHAEMTSGSHVVYKWFLEESIVTTIPKLETSISGPGQYVVKLEAWNDLTPPITVELPIVVENSISAVQIQITGSLVGHQTLIQVAVFGYLPFCTNVSFGDGAEAEICSGDPAASITSLEKELHLVSVLHVYAEYDEYLVLAVISNTVSNRSCSEVFVPIVSVSLTTRSRWVIKTPGHVVVRGVAEGGRNLQFTWDFSDDYEETIVKRYANKTSVAIHPFGLSGEYRVTLNVTGDHYPPPGVSVVLPKNVSVVDPIDRLKLSVENNAAAITNGRTKNIVFQAKSTGSHVTYIFDYEDGESEVVKGKQLSELYVDMTMYGNGRHFYTEEGVYKVKVTAVNPLGNMTFEMTRPFYVQEPPRTLVFHEGRQFKSFLNAYAAKVGEKIEFTARVLSGTNVTYDWKMGDQTDIVKAGPVVNHKYLTAGKKTVHITAKNKVHKLEENITVFVNHEIQGVEIEPERTVVAVGESILYKAKVRPAYTGIVTNYIWTFKSPPTRSSRWGSGRQKHTSKSSRISKTFRTGGWCTASVFAQNAISNATSTTVNIHVIEKIINLEIVVVGNKLVNQSITFQYYTYAGSALNLTWSFGDGSAHVVTMDREVMHTFDRQGEYVITLTARNPVSSSSIRQMLFVLNEPYCNEPKVSILAETGMKVFKSHNLVLEADVATDCNITSLLAYDWLVKSPDTVARRDDRKKMVLPPGLLSYGKYSVELKVFMQGTNVYSNDSLNLEVVPSPLVSSIKGGLYRQVNRQDNVTIDGSDSYDPDNDTSRNMNYNWTCWFKTEDGKYGDNCFHGNTTDLDSQVAMDTPILSFPGRQLIAADNFTFTLKVSAPNKTSHSSFQVVHVIQQKTRMTNVKIICKKCSSGPVNSNEKLSFSLDCDNCTKSGTSYEWSLYRVADTRPFNPARAHDSSCVEPDGASYWSYKLAEEEAEKESQRETTSSEPAKEDNQSKTQESEADFEEEDDSDSTALNVEVDVDLDKDVPVTDDVTTQPVLPWDILIEGSPSEGINRRRREAWKIKRELLDSNDTTPIFGIPIVQQEGDPGRRGMSLRNRNSYSVSEDIDHPSSRRLPELPVLISEGSPGESGSSGGRQYPTGEKMKPIDETDIGTETSSGGMRDFDKLEGPQNDKLRRLTILDEPRFPTFLKGSDTKTGLTGPSLVIKSGVLKQGWTYIIEVKVFDTETGEKGEAKSSFVVNESPVYGKCTVSPDSGFALDTDFTVHCTDWREKDHLPLMYEVSYNSGPLEMKNLIYRGLDNSFSFKLPEGDHNKDHKVRLYIDILDGLLAKTVVCSIDVRVTPQSFLLGRNGSVGLLDANALYGAVERFTDALQDSVDRRDAAMSKVYIGYLATRLNKLTSNGAEADRGKLNTSSDQVVDWKDFSVEKRTNLLDTLKDLPIRDEAEVLQSVQALSYTTGAADELSQTSLDISLKILQSLSTSTQKLSNGGESRVEELIPLAVQAASSIIKSASGYGKQAERELEEVYKHIITESLTAVEELTLNELKHHVIMETPIETSADYFSVLASRSSTDSNKPVQIEQSKFVLPQSLDEIIKGSVGKHSDGLTNEECYQSHMTMFKNNPFSFGKPNEIQSSVSSLSLFDCDGRRVHVENLRHDQLIQVELPNLPSYVEVIPEHLLKKWAMNLHQFNMTAENYQHALHLVFNLVPVDKGRLFPISVLISHEVAPTPESYLFKYDFDARQNSLEIFLPAGSLNFTGKYFIGIVDATYNSGRFRRGEVTERYYTLHLWWGECLYWHAGREAWQSDGCWISQESTVEVTKCSCNHLTAFGGHFELIPNKLTVVDIENFFLPHRNPVTFSLISVILVLYCCLLVVCRRADSHDAMKGGIVYLLDNRPIDQQKYEITIETGFRKGAGTSAKISIILHGEEGMSETRELISEDNRPLFERNSRDKFILTLPDSIGKIWKVQVWHNNFGDSPSWYLSRVIVRDLNTGSMYYFICEKWLAVEEQDGKVEREFMALEGPLEFTKIFWSKGIEYMADFHLWTSLVTRPSYSGFMLTERLTCCLTALLMYMCLNAMWYKTAVTEYRGEFGLLDLSWRSIAVGGICCGFVTPVILLLQFLFRRSKPEHASSCHSRDEVVEWDRDYPSGKPNEQEVSEDSTEHVPPVMTYSLLDQSILNWPNIQHWAQKQWIKRQQSGRTNAEQAAVGGVLRNQATANVILRPSVNIADSPFSRHGLSELDQASSGFEDCSSLIRPKASEDSTHTTAAPSLAESMRTHKPQSIPDSFQTSKPPSVLDDVKTYKAPSISSTGSNKSSVLVDRKEAITNRIYLPFWCRYIAWALCGVICVSCAVVTIMYGFRFGVTKSTLWLQSLYFSFMTCVFLLNPVLILVAIIYSATRYRNDPRVFDHYDIFNREKAKEDLNRWKKQIENSEEGEALERGVAARQRSRYLRFARPPQEKQLIEARKKIMREKKAGAVLRETMAFLASIFLLLIMAYCKDTSSFYHLNSAVRNDLLKLGTPNFTAIKTREEWFDWTRGPFLETLHSHYILGGLNSEKVSLPYAVSHVIGNVNLRQQRVQLEQCDEKLPYVIGTCLDGRAAMETEAFGVNRKWQYSDSYHGYFIFKWNSLYDQSGFVVELESNRSQATKQLEDLQTGEWLDRQSRAVIIELTLYNAPTNLFTSVKLLLDLTPTGAAFTSVVVRSTHLFRYVSGWDNFVLACELMFFVVMMYKVKIHASKLIQKRRKYLTNLWTLLEVITCLISMGFCVCYVYRFLLVSDTVERLRSTYYEEFVDISFVAVWDEVLRSAVAVLLFLAFVKSLRLLRYNKQFAVFGMVYRKARREVLLFLGLFTVLLLAYSSLGRALFGRGCRSFKDLWLSVLTVSALLLRDGTYPEYSNPAQMYAVRIFIFSFTIFGTGFLTAYMVAVLSRYFHSRKKRRLLAMSSKEAMVFYWDQFQLWTGLKKHEILEEPEIILPPEFTMAEIEYQVEELLFRMNALTGTHSLPEKPLCYMTDSDCTYGGGDDGISSGGSEGQQVVEDRLEQRVQKIEDNLCSQEPFLAQLLQLDSLDDFSQEKEKQLRSHLELEIFRQLQIQRQEVLTPPGGGQVEVKGDKTTETKEGEDKPCDAEVPNSPGHDSNDSTSSSEAQRQTSSSGNTSNTSSQSSPSEEKFQKAKKPRTSLVLQTIHDLISKTDNKDSHDNSSSNPDSPRDKVSFARTRKDDKFGVFSEGSTSSKFEKNPSDSISKSNSDFAEGIKRVKKAELPVKPTFLQTREAAMNEGSKASPIMKLRTGGAASRSDSGSCTDRITTESSSGSEQDGFHYGRNKPVGKRSLRKTKSRGKGKGPDGLEPSLILDEEGEVAEELVENKLERTDEGDSPDNESSEHTVIAEIHT